MAGAEGGWRGAHVYTIGHSTRTLDELVDLLRAFNVSALADVRTIPRSRHNPQFNTDVLARALRARRIRYVHISRLGGLRHARKDSPNVGWRNASFRGYADYMATGDFDAGLAELRAFAGDGNVAVMCAEAVPWRCHRSLIADALTARGTHVEHITGRGRASPHKVTAFARIEGTRVTYPSEDPALATRAPFHLEATVRVLQRRPANLVDVWDAGRYLRVLPTPDGLVQVAVENKGTIEAPDVRLCVVAGRPATTTRAALAQTMRQILGLDVDPAPLQRLAEAQPRLRPTAVALRGMRPPRFPDLFETFANVIPFQQVSLDSGVAIVRRIVARFGEYIEHDGRRHHAFPSAAAVAQARVAALRACGLSARKAETLRALARETASGALTEERISHMTTPEALATLTDLSGIGPWSAAVVLLRGLRRLDVFPPGDVGAQRALAALTGDAAGAPLARLIAHFADHRGYLYFYALGASLLAKGLIHAAPPR
jgi:3-methyladenine DNA glycosylase/8-oxoguanine DNA glycosylase